MPCVVETRCRAALSALFHDSRRWNRNWQTSTRSSRRLGTGERIQAHLLLGRLQRQGAVHVRRNPHHEMAAIVLLRQRFGDRVSGGSHVSECFAHHTTNSGKGLLRRIRKPAQRWEGGAQPDMLAVLRRPSYLIGLVIKVHGLTPIARQCVTGSAARGAKSGPLINVCSGGSRPSISTRMRRAKGAASSFARTTLAETVGCAEMALNRLATR